MRVLTFFILLLTIPLTAQAWQGKVIAVDDPTTLVVLKDGQYPIKIKLSGIEPAPDIKSSKGKLECSGIALMKDVDVNEIGKDANNIVLADVTIDGLGLAQELIKAGVAKQTGQISAGTPPIAQVETAPTSNEIISELSEDTQSNSDSEKQYATPEPLPQSVPANPPVIRYVQVQEQPQQLGFWPARQIKTVPLQVAPSPSLTENYATDPNDATSLPAPSTMTKPGDIADQDYNLAVSVKQSRPHKKKAGFFVPKKKSETFIGAAIGTQYSTKSKTDVPYSSFGPSGGLAIRHFYPSGFGLGGDMLISGTSGRSGTIAASSNATNSTSYDYKSKSFNTYTFTASLLYRFYTDSKFSPYIAAQGGYSFFGYPNTDFSLSDGAPVAGGGLGFLYEFDSGFTIGSDVRYLKTFGTKSDDPDGFLNTTINLGYTFD
ncbi:outer membrane beta-barrel protein [Desulfovibrio gilichinskyi]|uniref:Endonuclease YncB, thermonuclease family n=1 Tax=Desulfovibrio gilichinskyi TaxID=1519643 RepID=A0A1X7CDT9_9BACT|nr:outer membrane beta-barrel protein [Desulfovibrio gilichinskyi]SME94907.1 Endonuclease YncB, thermonuclease family [Desulfovibrio gilichinskyi]